MAEHKALINSLLTDYNLTSVQISEALGVTYQTIYRWKKADEIKPVNVQRLKKMIAELESGKNLSGSLLTAFDTKALVKELSARGWRVTLTAK